MLTTEGATRLAARTIALFRSWLSWAEESGGPTWVVGATEDAGRTVDDGAKSSSSRAFATGLQAAQRFAVSRMHHDWISRSRKLLPILYTGSPVRYPYRGFPNPLGMPRAPDLLGDAD